MLKLTRLAAVAMIAVTASAVPAAGQSVGRIIGSWHRLMQTLADELTRGIGSGQGFAVDYNSNFNDIEIGTIIAPASGNPNASSLNLIGKCDISTGINETDGDDLPTGTASGEFNFSASGSAPPSFLTRALQSVSIGLRLERRRTLAYSFTDIRVRQVYETDFDRIMATPECVAQFNNRPVVFVIRGNYLMKLSMAQGESMSSGIEANAAYGTTATSDNARVGFNVSWNRRGDWKIEQKQARPWFRIVAKLERQPDGTYRVARDRAAR